MTGCLHMSQEEQDATERVGIVTRPRGCGGGAIDIFGDGGGGAIVMFSDGGGGASDMLCDVTVATCHITNICGLKRVCA